MSTEKENLKALVKNGKTRTNMLLVGGMILLLFIIGFFLFNKKQPPTSETIASVSGTKTIQASVIPGTSTSEKVNQNQEAANIINNANAEKANQTFLPTLVNKEANSQFENIQPIQPIQTAPNLPQVVYVQAPTQTPVAQNLPPPEPKIVIDTAAADEAKRKQLEDKVKAAEDADQRAALKDAIAQRKNAYTNQLQVYVGEWVPRKQFVENVYIAPNATTLAASANVQREQQAAQEAANVGASTEPKEVLAEAGTFAPAILSVGVNTDYPGPVVANIAAGPLKGAVVTGKIVTGPDGAALQFTSLNIPGKSPVQFEGYAVSEQLSEYKMGTDVNHHYLTNFGAIFGAALLEGYGEAVQDEGKTVIVTDTGSVVETQGSLTNEQITKKAVGNVASKVGQELLKSGTRPPTVRVDVGTSFLILFAEKVEI